MSYYLLLDEDEIQVASINGWKMLKSEITDAPPTLLDLFDNGEVDDAEMLREELQQLPKLSDSSSSIVAEMIETLTGVTGPVVLSDGMTDEDVADDWMVKDDDDTSGQ